MAEKTAEAKAEAVALYPFGCLHYQRAMDAHVGRAYWGYDNVVEWPFARIVPLGSEPKECDYCKKGLAKDQPITWI